MSLSSDRVTAAAMAEMVSLGFAPDEVLVGDTGKSAMELTISAIAKAMISEIKTNGKVTVTLDEGLASWMGTGVVVASDGGASLKASLVASDASGTYSSATGGME